MIQTSTADAPTTNDKLLDWVGEIAELTQPDAIHWCDGSAEEYDALAQALIDGGTFERLSDAKRPNSYLALSDPGDVAGIGEGEVGVGALGVREALEGARVDQGLGEGVVLLSRAVAPVDGVGLGQVCDLPDPVEELCVGGRRVGRRHLAHLQHSTYRA